MLGMSTGTEDSETERKKDGRVQPGGEELGVAWKHWAENAESFWAPCRSAQD